jgi:dihydrofolate synthase/folylpolyglutamate synthase
VKYQETVDFLFAQFPAFQKDGSSAYKPGLSRIFELSELVGNPHEKFKSVHLAGTNGKGSTSHMLASVLQEAGYKVGLFTSPHLKDFRERIKINGVEVGEEFVVDFVSKFKISASEIKPSFFEYTTVMAFDFFAKEKVDIAIIETGLGGRLDCSNIITPEVAVITNIGLDHVQFLGGTLGEIAKEKAGIIKYNVPVVIGRKQGETVTVFDFFAIQNKSKIYWAENTNVDYNSDLKGWYQKENIKTAVSTLNILREESWDISLGSIEKGLLNVVKNTGLKGRWQSLGEYPKVICDTGHNEDGLKQITAQLRAESYEQLHIVWGMVDDKDATSILKLLPKDAKYYWCKPQIGRGLAVKDLVKVAQGLGLVGEEFASVELAKKHALSMATSNDMLFIGGSTFVVAEVI